MGVHGKRRGGGGSGGKGTGCWRDQDGDEHVIVVQWKEWLVVMKSHPVLPISASLPPAVRIPSQDPVGRFHLPAHNDTRTSIPKTLPQDTSQQAAARLCTTPNPPFPGGHFPLLVIVTLARAEKKHLSSTESCRLQITRLPHCPPSDLPSTALPFSPSFILPLYSPFQYHLPCYMQSCSSTWRGQVWARKPSNTFAPTLPSSFSATFDLCKLGTYLCPTSVQSISHLFRWR